jgi:formamidopyrimidine-DNA glycosylase
MPELPEVETVRTQLEKHTVGKTVSAIESFHERSLTGNPVKVTGRKITDIKRYGKMLILELGKEWVIGIHLKMSGQLIYQKPGAGRLKQDKHTRVIIKFNSGDYLIFNDQRIFGWVKIMKSEELRTMNYIKNLGPEPWDISDEEFFNKIRTRNRPIKLVILYL